MMDFLGFSFAEAVTELKSPMIHLRIEVILEYCNMVSLGL